MADEPAAGPDRGGPDIIELVSVPGFLAFNMPGAPRPWRSGAKSSSDVPMSGPVTNRPPLTSGATSAQNRAISEALPAWSAGSPRTPALAPPTCQPSAAYL